MSYSSSITYIVPIIVEVFAACMTMSRLVEVGEVLHPAGLGVLGDSLDCSRRDSPGGATCDIVELSYIHPTGSTRQQSLRGR